MADDYQFKEAFTDNKKVREAIEVGTDGNGNPILRNVVEVEPGNNALDVSAATVNVQENTALDVSAATVSVQEATALDVSAATVTVQENTALDVSASTVTVTDNGALDINSLPSLPAGGNNIGSVDLASQSAGLAQDSSVSSVETAVDEQDSYGGLNKSPPADSTFGTPYDGILPAAVDGDIEVIDGEGNTVVIPQGALSAGQVLPVEVTEISSTNTTQTLSDILLVRS